MGGWVSERERERKREREKELVSHTHLIKVE